MGDLGSVIAVSRHNRHGLGKPVCDEITLVAGLGVAGDAHQGATVQHLYLMKKDPAKPNLRQVHLIHQELIDELQAAGFRVGPGVMGENVTTRGVDLLALPRGALLHVGASVIVAVTGLRNPCWQLDKYQAGLMAATLGRDAQGELVRKAGVMGVVIEGGTVRADDAIRVVLPPEPHERLKQV